MATEFFWPCYVHPFTSFLKNGMFEALLATRKPVASIGASYALMAGGSVTVYPNVNTDKYDFINKAVAAGTAMNAAQVYVPGCGNNTLGVWSGGNNGQSGGAAITSYTNIYTWATDIVTQGTNLPGTDYDQGATSTANTGYFAGGAVAATVLRKYGFAGNAWTTGTALPSGGKGYPSCAGNGTMGLFTGVGGNSRYTYAGDTVAAGAGLTQFRSRGGGMSIPTVAMFCCGWGDGGAGILATSDRHTYASNTNATGSNFSLARQRLSASTNGVTGIVAAGWNTTSVSQSITEEYNWSSTVVTTGSSLGNTRHSFGNVASIPSHLN